METTTNRAAAMTAARTQCAGSWYGATTLMAGIDGHIQGTGLSVVAFDVRDRAAVAVLGDAGTDAPATGHVDPRLEEAPV